jgi:REP element-mobilizing transposase RayT
MSEDFRNPAAFDWGSAEEVSRRNLPHLRQDDALYFVTFRLGDSLPAEKLHQWRLEREQWLRQNPPPHSADQHRQEVLLWDHRINRWLDAGHGCCCLADPVAVELMEGALRHHDGERYRLGDFVVMPNHVHALLMPLNGWDLSKILHSWKSFTAHRINQSLGRSGSLWQDESFDHIVRDDAAWAKFSRYIRGNAESVPPGRARLGYGALRK